MVVEAGSLDKLREGIPSEAEAGGRSLVLILWQGDVYALRNICPHMAKSFELGDVHKRATGTVGAPAFSTEDAVLTCPWHQYEYALDTGRCLTDRRLRVRAYKTVVEGGKVYVDLDSRGRVESRSASRH